MKNITELREDLSEVFTGLRNGSVDPKVAKEINNAAGKIIHTGKVQLEDASLTKIKPRIPYIK